MGRFLAVSAVLIWGLIFSNYLTVLFISAVTAFLALPIYRNLRARMRESLAITCFSTGMFVCVVTPISIVAGMVIPQVILGASRFGEWWQAGHTIPPAISKWVNTAYGLFIEYVPNGAEHIEKLEEELTGVINEALKMLLSRGINIAGGTMGLVTGLCFFIVFTTIFVVYAPYIRSTILQILPGRDDMVDRFSLAIANAGKAVFIGIVFVPIVQGTLTGVGLYFLKVPDAAFWGLLSVFAAVIPMVGTALIWIPASVYLWATQSLGSALGLFAYGAIVVSGADSLLRPYFLKTGINASMFLLMISIICSMTVFGAVGLIAGPVLVALAVQSMTESKILSARLAEKENA